MNSSLFGMLLFALGGLAGAVFALPFRGIRGWRYESYWFVYAVSGLVVFPMVLAKVTCPAVFDIISGTPTNVLVRCVGFGALWGLGGLTWGLMIRYLGIGLGLAVGCGLCSATGTLIPPIVTGHAADLVKDAGALMVLGGVAASLVGIVLVGLAGKSKEGELSEEEKKKSVAEFDFRKGMIVAVFSGVASAGMNFGLQGGEAMEVAAKNAGTAAAWAGMPVLVVVLLGGFIVNGAWCLWQNCKNKSFGDYRRTDAGWCLAALAGIIWAMQFACQKIGEPAMGEMRYISFAVVMGASVLFSTLLGICLGEWKGTGKKTKAFLVLGILIMVAGFCVISFGQK